MSPDETAAIRAQLARRLDEAGRPRASVTLSLRTSVAVDDAARARPSARTLETLRRDRDAYARAGIDHLVVGLRPAESVERLEALYADTAAALLD